jgi:hypothetical protein
MSNLSTGTRMTAIAQFSKTPCLPSCAPSQTIVKGSSSCPKWSAYSLTVSITLTDAIALTHSTQQVDEPVDEWTPESVCALLVLEEQTDLTVSGTTGPRANAKRIVYLARHDFTGLVDNETIKFRATEIVCDYGVGTWRPPGFSAASYAFLGRRCGAERLRYADVNIDLELPYSRPPRCRPKIYLVGCAWIVTVRTCYVRFISLYHVLA